MWQKYHDGSASYPALAVYLAATHHGKARTVLRSTTAEGDDVFGVRSEPSTLVIDNEQWPLDFSIAKDGAEGRWEGSEFVLTGHGWTGLVADLLGRGGRRRRATPVSYRRPSRVISARSRWRTWKRSSASPTGARASSRARAPSPARCVMAAERRLPVLALPGLSPDSLGNYLASARPPARVLTRKWPSTRVAWRDEVLQVVGGPPTLDELLDELMKVATAREWTPYNRGWSEEQKKGTKTKSGAAGTLARQGGRA